MFGHRLLRACLVIGMLALLVAVPATPTLAGTSKATAAVVALPGSVTLTDNSSSPAVPHFGVLKVTLKTKNNATHVVLNVLLTTTASASSIAFVQANLPAGSSGCTTSGPFSLTCSLANAASNSTQATFIQYQTPDASTCSTTPCSLTATATFSFSEGSNDQSTGPNGSRNDTVTAPPSSQLLYKLADVSTAGGDCGSALTLGTQATATHNQTTQLVVSGLPSPVAGTQFPCAPAEVSVTPVPHKFNTPLGFTQAWTLNIPTSPQMATATLYMFKLSGSNANKFQLMEYVPGSSDPNFGFFAVPQCNVDGTIPISNLLGITYDTCVVDKQQFGSGGVQVTIHTQPTGDPSYGG